MTPSQIEGPLALAQCRLEHDLKQEVAELCPVRGRVVHRLEHLVGLLEQVGPQGVEGLPAIPRAAVLGQQPVHQVPQPLEPGPQPVLILPWYAHEPFAGTYHTSRSFPLTRQASL